MDASDEIVKWARDANYSFIDLNVFPNPRAATESKDIMVSGIPLLYSLLRPSRGRSLAIKGELLPMYGTTTSSK